MAWRPSNTGLRNYASDIPFLFVSGVMGEEVAIETLETAGRRITCSSTGLERLGPAVQAGP